LLHHDDLPEAERYRCVAVKQYDTGYHKRTVARACSFPSSAVRLHEVSIDLEISIIVATILKQFNRFVRLEMVFFKLDHNRNSDLIQLLFERSIISTAAFRQNP